VCECVCVCVCVRITRTRIFSTEKAGSRGKASASALGR